MFDLNITLPAIVLALFGTFLNLLGAVSYNRQNNRAKFVAFILWAAAQWNICYAAELAVPGLQQKLFWDACKMIGAAFLPVLWLRYAIDFLEIPAPRKYVILPLLSIVPVITIVLSFTNELHGLIWRSYRLEQIGRYIILEQELGTWMIVSYIYFYILLIGSFILLIRNFKKSGTENRKRILLPLVTMAVLWVFNILDLLPFFSLSGLTLTPFGFGLAGAALAISVIVLGIDNIIPLSQSTVVQQVSDLVFIAGPSGKIISANPAARGIFPSAVTRRDLPITDIFPDWKNLMTDTSIKEQHLELMIDGNNKTFSANKSMLTDMGVYKGFVVTLHDVTEEQRSKTALADSETKWKALFDYAPGAFFLYNLEGMLLKVNRSTETMVNASADQIEGRSIIDAGVIPKRQMPLAISVLRNNRKEIPTGPDLFTTYIPGRGKVEIELSTYPLQLEGEATILGIAHDVTESRKIIDSLAKAQSEADAASRAKSEFIAHMSHELRTPLNHIIGFTSFVLDGVPGSLNPKQNEYLTDVLDSSQHLLYLINELLDLSRIESGKIEIAKTSCELRKIIEDSITMVKDAEKKRTIVLDIADLDSSPAIMLDERKIKQVLYNLLSNAVKFTSETGTITVTARVENQTKDKTAMISVQDDGIGIDPKNLEVIFKPFNQAARGPEHSRQGTGLGLTISQRFIELHGGRLWAESSGDGLGSCFTIELPCSS